MGFEYANNVEGCRAAGVSRPSLEPTSDRERCDPREREAARIRGHALSRDRARPVGPRTVNMSSMETFPRRLNDILRLCGLAPCLSHHLHHRHSLPAPRSVVE